MVSAIAGILLGPWCWAALTLVVVIAAGVVLGAGELAVRRRTTKTSSESREQT